MASFFVLYDEWECAATAAACASARLCRRLDAYCDGLGTAPSPEEVAQAKCLLAQANARLLALRSMLNQQRERVALI